MKFVSSFIISSLAMTMVTAKATSQCATITETKKITASSPMPNDFFGTSVALKGDDAIVGAKEDSTRFGSAYIYNRNIGGADNWGEVVKLLPLDAQTAGDELGISVGNDGDFAIVGVHRDDDLGQDSGSAYIFSRNQNGADSWGQVAKLTAIDGLADDRFGFSVALSGDVCIVGAHLDDLPGKMDAGSAYIFRRDLAGNWNFEKKLTASNAAAFAEFGTSVSIEGNLVAVGAPLANSEGGAAYVFRFDGLSTWSEEIILTESSGVGDDTEQFGNAVAVQSNATFGERVVVGAHLYDDCTGCGCGGGFSGSANTGAVFVYRRLGMVWGSGVQLVPTGCNVADNIGLSVGVESNEVIVGASGKAFMFRDEGLGVWSETLALQPGDLPADSFGKSTAISAGIGLIGANLDGTSSVGASFVFVPPDCNGNGIPDACDIVSGFSKDCNTNGVPDDCDIAGGTSEDCDGNEVPDECDILRRIDVVFIIDGSGSIGANTFQLELQGIINCLCGEDAVVTADGKYSVSVIQFTANQIVEIPRTVLDSPATVQSVCTQVGLITKDGGGTALNPALLEAMTIFTQGFGESRTLIISTDGGLSDTSASETSCSNLRNMSPPVKLCTALVGIFPCPTSGMEFQFMQNCANTPLSSTFNLNEPIGSYDCIVDAAEYDPLCASCFPFSGGTSFDCNGNGIPDECEPDCDGNGTIDTCEVSPCPEDIVPLPCGNQTVNIDDLVAVLNGFGPCPALPLECPADIAPQPGGNGVVNIDDLVAVLTAFGPCPAPGSGGGGGTMLAGLELTSVTFDLGFPDASGVVDANSAALVSAAWAANQSGSNPVDVYRLWVPLPDWLGNGGTISFAGGGVASGVGGTSEPLVLSPGKGATFFVPTGDYNPVNLGMLAIDGGPGLEFFQEQAWKSCLTMGSITSAGPIPMKLGNIAALDGILTGAVNDANTGWGVLGSVFGQYVVSDGNGGWRILIGQFTVPRGKTFTAAVRLVGDGVDTYATVSSLVTTLP